MPERNLTEARDEVKRELCVRKRCFPRWIEDGRLSSTDAVDRIERLEAALHVLNKAADLAAASAEVRPVTSTGDMTPDRPF